MDINSVSSNKVVLNIQTPQGGEVPLNKGEVIQAQVQDVGEDGQVTIVVKGKAIEAAAEIPVKPGQQLLLVVDDMRNGKTYLKVVTPEIMNKIENANISASLVSMGVSANEDTILLTRKLLQYNLPVNQNNLIELNKNVKLLGGMNTRNLEIAAFALSRGIGGKAALESLAQFLSPQTDTAKLLPVLERILSALVTQTDNPVQPENRPAPLNQSSGQPGSRSAVPSGNTEPIPAGNTYVNQEQPAGEPGNKAVPSDAPNKSVNVQSSAAPQGNSNTPGIGFSDNTGIKTGASATKIVISNTEPEPMVVTNNFKESNISAVLDKNTQTDGGVSKYETTTKNTAPTIIGPTVEETSEVGNKQAVQPKELQPGESVNVKNFAKLTEAYNATNKLNSLSNTGIDREAISAGQAKGDNQVTPPTAARVPNTAPEPITPNLAVFSEKNPAGEGQIKRMDESSLIAQWASDTDLSPDPLIRSIGKVVESIRNLMEIDPESPASTIADKLQEKVLSDQDIVKALTLLKDLAESKNINEKIPNLKEFAVALNDMEKEIAGQQIFNTSSKTSIENLSSFYFSFPVPIDQGYSLCQLKVNKEGRRNLKDVDRLSFVVALNTSKMGRVLFHVNWFKAGQLEIQGVVENRASCDYLNRNTLELVQNLQALGYRVKHNGVKVAKTPEEMVVRPVLTEAHESPRPLGIDVTV